MGCVRFLCSLLPSLCSRGISVFSFDAAPFSSSKLMDSFGASGTRMLSGAGAGAAAWVDVVIKYIKMIKIKRLAFNTFKLMLLNVLDL